MDKKGLNLKVAVVFLLALVVVLSGQQKRPVAPVKKRKINEKIIPNKSVAKKTGDELELESVRVEKTLKEKIKLPSKPLAKVSRTGFVSLNPLRKQSFIMSGKSTEKSVKSSEITPFGNSAFIGGGNYGTFDAGLNIALPEVLQTVVKARYYRSNGNNDYSGQQRYSVYAKVNPFKEIDLPFSAEYRFRENYQVNIGRRIFDESRFRLSGTWNWRRGDLTGESTVLNDWSGFNFADSLAGRSENLFTFKTTLGYTVNDYRLSGAIDVGFQYFSSETEKSGSGTPYFYSEIIATKYISQSVGIKAGMKGYFISRYYLSASGIKKMENKGALPVAEIWYSSPIGIFAVKYDPRILYGYDFSKVKSSYYANLYFAGSRFNTLLDRERLEISWQNSWNKLKILFTSGWENKESIPVLLSEDSVTSGRWFNASAERYFGNLRVWYDISSKLRLDVELTAQKFYQIKPYSRLPFYPDYILNYGGVYKLFKNANIRGRLIYTSEQYKNPDDGKALAGQLNMDIGLDYSPVSSLKLDFNLSNLFNSEIWVAPTYSLPGIMAVLSAKYFF